MRRNAGFQRGRGPRVPFPGEYSFQKIKIPLTSRVVNVTLYNPSIAANIVM
jgi:hypothetical protein